MELESESTRLWLILASINAVLGLILFEWAWYKTKRARNPIQELNAQFPELCRHDAPNWQKWKFYPGAVTVMIPRAIFICGSFLALAIIISLLMVCYERRRPLSNPRKIFVHRAFKAYAYMVTIFGWFTFCTSAHVTPE